jgi:hypothetical protein
LFSNSDTSRAVLKGLWPGGVVVVAEDGLLECTIIWTTSPGHLTPVDGLLKKEQLNFSGSV